MAPPFSLSCGSSIYAIVMATNVVGNSMQSNPGNGGVITTNPDAPVSLANVATVTSATSIGLIW